MSEYRELFHLDRSGKEPVVKRHVVHHIDALDAVARFPKEYFLERPTAPGKVVNAAEPQLEAVLKLTGPDGKLPQGAQPPRSEAEAKDERGAP